MLEVTLPLLELLGAFSSDVDVPFLISRGSRSFGAGDVELVSSSYFCDWYFSRVVGALPSSLANRLSVPLGPVPLFVGSCSNFK